MYNIGLEPDYNSVSAHITRDSLFIEYELNGKTYTERLISFVRTEFGCNLFKAQPSLIDSISNKEFNGNGLIGNAQSILFWLSTTRDGRELIAESQKIQDKISMFGLNAHFDYQALPNTLKNTSYVLLNNTSTLSWLFQSRGSAHMLINNTRLLSLITARGLNSSYSGDQFPSRTVLEIIVSNDEYIDMFNLYPDLVSMLDENRLNSRIKSGSCKGSTLVFLLAGTPKRQRLLLSNPLLVSMIHADSLNNFIDDGLFKSYSTLYALSATDVGRHIIANNNDLIHNITLEGLTTIVPDVTVTTALEYLLSYQTTSSLFVRNDHLRGLAVQFVNKASSILDSDNYAESKALFDLAMNAPNLLSDDNVGLSDIIRKKIDKHIEGLAVEDRIQLLSNLSKSITGSNFLHRYTRFSPGPNLMRNLPKVFDDFLYQFVSDQGKLPYIEFDPISLQAIVNPVMVGKTVFEHSHIYYTLLATGKHPCTRADYPRVDATGKNIDINSYITCPLKTTRMNIRRSIADVLDYYVQDNIVALLQDPDGLKFLLQYPDVIKNNLSINKLSSFKFDALPAALIQLYCTDQQASALKSKPGSSLVDVLACSKGYNFLKLLADESILRGLSVFDDKDNSRTSFSCFGLKLF